MATASYIKKIRVTADITAVPGSETGDYTVNADAEWHELPAMSPTLNDATNIIETTNMQNNAGWRRRIYGLHDWSISADCDYSANHAGLTACRNAKLNRTKLAIQYLPFAYAGVGQPLNIAMGFQGFGLVESFNLSGETDGKETVAISLQGDGPLGDAS